MRPRTLRVRSDCNDCDPCTQDRCGVDACGLDRCQHALVPGCRLCARVGDCGDGDFCTRDVCRDGTCGGIRWSGATRGAIPSRLTVLAHMIVGPGRVLDHAPGGAVGAWVGEISASLLSTAGAVLAFGVVGLVAVLLLTRKSIFEIGRPRSLAA